MFERARNWMGAALVAGTVVTLAPDLGATPLQEGSDRKQRSRGEEEVQRRDARGERPPSDRAGADAKGGERSTDRAGDRASGGREQGREGPSARAVEASVGSMMRFENLHRRRMARIERLMQIYREKGDQQHLAELERLRERQRTIYRDGMARYERELGPERFVQVRRGMERRGADRPPAPRSDRASDRANAGASDRATDREQRESDRPQGATDRRGETREGEHRESDRKGQREQPEKDRESERKGERGKSSDERPRDSRNGEGRKDG